MISLEESAAEFDKDRAVTGEGAEEDGEAVILLLRGVMGCPLTSLSSKDPPVEVLAGALPLLPSSTGMTLSLVLFRRACKLGVSLLVLPLSLIDLTMEAGVGCWAVTISRGRGEDCIALTCA